MPRAAPSPSPSAVEPGLSRERIAAAGLRILETEGIDALSMRRLADELEVGTMTLYGYVRDKEDLLDAVLDQGAGDEPLPPPEGPWRDQLRALMHELHRVLRARPHLTRLRFSRPIVTPSAFRYTEAGLRALQEAGFERDEAARAFRCLFVWVFGITSFNSEHHAEGARHEASAAIAALPPDEFPLVTESIAELTATLAGEQQFGYGLERLLDGFEAQLAKPDEGFTPTHGRRGR